MQAENIALGRLKKTFHLFIKNIVGYVLESKFKLLENKIIENQIRFYPRFLRSKSVLSASKLDADFTDSLKRKR